MLFKQKHCSQRGVIISASRYGYENEQMKITRAQFAFRKCVALNEEQIKLTSYPVTYLPKIDVLWRKMLTLNQTILVTQ